MLRKGSSIHRLCEEHPSYAQAVPRTFYGKNNLIGPGTTRDALNNDSNNGDEFEGNKTVRFRFGDRERRNKSVALAGKTHGLSKGVSDLDFGQMSLNDINDPPVVKIPCKFPPPPYLPGELERRKRLMNEDSEMERERKKLEYEQTLFHYF